MANDDTRPDLGRIAPRIDLGDLEEPRQITHVFGEQTAATSADQYTLIERIAEGGMAEIWRASGPQGSCVVKRVRADLLDRHDVMAMFRDEVRLALRLDHPNIVRALGAGTLDGMEILALEELEGATLASLVAQERLPWKTVLPIALEVTSALAYVHAQGIVHRDLCAENVVLTHSGAKVIDFGIARWKDREHATRLGEIKGRLDRMPPEQKNGESVDARTDLFALGKMLDDTVNPRARPQRLVELIERLCALSPEERPESALAVEAMLRKIEAEPDASGDFVATLFERAPLTDSSERAATRKVPVAVQRAPVVREVPQAVLVIFALALAVTLIGALVALGWL